MSGPSITSWNRLEPRPRSEGVARSLAAQVRDPLWFLTRQWQLGEFQGEDAASPAWVEFRAQFSKIDGWITPEGVTSPLEAVIENEPFTPDDATAVELGQQFEAILVRAFNASPATLPMTLTQLVQNFRIAYPLGVQSAAPTDQRTRAFRRVCTGRALDGCALYEATRQSLTPRAPSIQNAGLLDVIRTAVQGWRIWVQDVLGELGRSDASTWQPERLEYSVQVSATIPTGSRATLTAHPGRDGAFHWYAFDQQSVVSGESGPTTEVTRSLLPIGVHFRGMPHARWWQMQDRLADLGEVDIEVRELAKMILMDFFFVHGNDWFVVPFTQEVGTLCRVDRLIVHDVFGGRTMIDRADRPETGATESTRRWSMFAITAPVPGGLADYFILPPSAGSATLSGEPIEIVNLIRDEMANMVWAIEHTTENGIGMPWLGRERTRTDDRQPAASSAAGTPALRYRIQGSVPAHWIPFVPVRIDEQGQVALEQAPLLQPLPEQGVQPERILTGRILTHPDPYRVREEEVSRAGVTVSRVVRRARWIDGSTHLWVARRKQAGRGEGSSGLRFDTLEQSKI